MNNYPYLARKYIYNSLHLAQKYACICLRGWSVPRSESVSFEDQIKSKGLSILSFNEASRIIWLIWIHQRSPVPMEFLCALVKSAASRSRQVCVPYSIIPYVSGGLYQMESPLVLLQFTKKIFRSQLKIIEQSHYFELWVKLWNAAFAAGFIHMFAVNYIFTTRIHTFPFLRFATFVRSTFNWGGTWQKQTDWYFVPWCCQGFRPSWPRHPYSLFIILIEKLKWYDVTGQLLD